MGKLKVIQSRNDFFKPTFLPKNEWTNSTLVLWNLRSACFCSFFGRNWSHKKDISKLTDLYKDYILVLHFECRTWNSNLNLKCLKNVKSKGQSIASVQNRIVPIFWDSNENSCMQWHFEWERGKNWKNLSLCSLLLCTVM